MISLTGSEVLEDDFDVIPEGEYSTVIEKCEWKKHYEGDREELNYQIRIVGPKYANRVLFKKFDVNNVDEIAKKKAITSLKKFAVSFGIKDNDFDEYSVVNKNINVVVSIYKTKKDEERNSIFYFKPFKDTSDKSSIAKMVMGQHDVKPDSSFAGSDIPF